VADFAPTRQPAHGRTTGIEDEEDDEEDGVYSVDHAVVA